MEKKKSISFINLKEGQSAVFISIAGGWQAAKRLSDLGLVPGTKIKILRKASVSGPIEIELRRSKLVIGKGLASKILVKMI